MLFYLGREIEAEEELRRTLVRSPDNMLVMCFLGEVLYYEGKIREAEPLLVRAAELWWPADAPAPLWYDPADFAAFLYASLGQRDKIDSRILKTKPERVYDVIMAPRRAGVYALLEEKASALAWLRRAVELGYHNYPWYARDKNLDKLRGDLEFQRIMADVKARWDHYGQLFGGESKQ
jgi:serine/threonine-protein kinase